MISWLIPLVGAKAARPVFFILAAVLAFGLAFTLGRCRSDNPREQQQARQNVRSSEAYAEAVTNGVAVIDNRAVTESALAEATVAVKEEIGNAASLGDIRNSLVTRLCQRPEHKEDAACAR